MSKNEGPKAQDVIKRKEEGIDVVLKEKVEAKQSSTLLENVHLIHTRENFYEKLKRLFR